MKNSPTVSCLTIKTRASNEKNDWADFQIFQFGGSDDHNVANLFRFNPLTTHPTSHGTVALDRVDELLEAVKNEAKDDIYSVSFSYQHNSTIHLSNGDDLLVMYPDVFHYTPNTGELLITPVTAGTVSASGLDPEKLDNGLQTLQDFLKSDLVADNVLFAGNAARTLGLTRPNKVDVSVVTKVPAISEKHDYNDKSRFAKRPTAYFIPA